MAPITRQGGRWIQGAPGWTGALHHGALVGGTRWRFPPGGWLTCLLGRRKLYFVGPALFVACSIGQFWADTGLALFLFRFLIGIGVGFEYPVAGAMLVEFMPKKQRGPRLAMLTILWFAGAACSVVITVLFVVGCLIATKLINVIGRRSMLIHSLPVVGPGAARTGSVLQRLGGAGAGALRRLCGLHRRRPGAAARLPERAVSHRDPLARRRHRSLALARRGGGRHVAGAAVAAVHRHRQHDVRLPERERHPEDSRQPVPAAMFIPERF